MNLTHPKECTSAEEIRNEIDKIYKQIIELFAERHKYVEEIVRFKNDKEGVIAQDRKQQVILDRGEWAGNLGLDAETFEKIYQILIENNIKHELKLLKRKNSAG